MDILAILNKLPTEAAETLMNLSPEERELVYTRGIMAHIFDEEFEKKHKQKDLIFMIQNDPSLYNIKNIKSPKVIKKAALNKIFEMKTIDEVKQYFDYLDILISDDYAINSVDTCFK
jgi:transcription elongation factor